MGAELDNAAELTERSVFFLEKALRMFIRPERKFPRKYEETLLLLVNAVPLLRPAAGGGSDGLDGVRAFKYALLNAKERLRNGTLTLTRNQVEVLAALAYETISRFLENTDGTLLEDKLDDVPLNIVRSIRRKVITRARRVRNELETMLASDRKARLLYCPLCTSQSFIFVPGPEGRHECMLCGYEETPEVCRTCGSPYFQDPICGRFEPEKAGLCRRCAQEQEPRGHEETGEEGR